MRAVAATPPHTAVWRPLPTPRSLGGARNWVRNRLARVAYTYVQHDLQQLDVAVDRLGELALVLVARVDELARHQARVAEDIQRSLDYLSLHLPLPSTPPGLEEDRSPVEGP